MQNSAPAPLAKRAADFAGRNYHWFFAGIAVLLVLVRYMPATCLSAINADGVQVPLLYHDVIGLGHSAHHWEWGGHSDIFPDLLLGFLLNFLLRDGLLSIEVAYCVMLVAYIVVVTLLYRKNGGRHPETFAAMLLLFFVLSLINFGIGHGLHFYNSLVLAGHTGPAIIAVACFALCQRAALKGYSKSFWWLPVFCFLTSLSDEIFQVIFPIPMLAALVIARLLYPDKVRMFPSLVAGILIPCAAGHLLVTRLSPFEIDPEVYTHFDPAAAARSWHQFLQMLVPSTGGDFIIFATLDFFFVVFATVLLAHMLFKPAANRLPLHFFILLLFIACEILSNWGAAILTGNYNFYAARHVRMTMLLPVFYLLGYANHAIPWSRAGSGAAVAAFSIATACCALFLTPPPGRYCQEMRQLVPILREVMEKEHIEAGLGDYWYASPIVLFSQNTLPIRSVSADGSLLHWVNTTEWYTGDGGSNPPPKFRLIVMAKLNSDQVRRRYGAPSRIIPGVSDGDIWIYSEEKSIRYNPVFGMLSNDPVNEFHMDGDVLPFITGEREGTSRVARAGRDRATILTYGPYPYLQPVAGHYRITITHTYLSAPEAGKLATFDVICSEGTSTRTLDQGTIPFIDNSRHELTREIVIPEAGHGLLQVRTQYHGSGDISIDSLGMVYLGK